MRRKKHYSVLSFILALAMIFTSIPLDVRAEVTNVAQGKTATASSYEVVSLEEITTLKADDDSLDYPTSRLTPIYDNAANADNAGNEILDNEPSTHWHTAWAGGAQYANNEAARYIGVRFDAVEEVAGIRYLPAQGDITDTNNGKGNGRIKEYRAEYRTSTDGEWITCATGTIDHTVQDWQLIEFDEPVNALEVRLVGVKTYTAAGDNKHLSCAEFRVYEPIEDVEKPEYCVVFPSVIDESATLEGESAVKLNDVTTNHTGQWSLQVTEKDWASGGKILNCLNGKNGVDTAEYSYYAPVAGTYTITLTYRSGESSNTLAWSEKDGKITAGSVVAGANDSAGNTHTVVFEMEVVTAGEGTLILAATETQNAPQIDKLDIVLTAVPADKTALQTAINSLADLVEDDYSEESWAAFTHALDAANLVNGQEDATQEEIDAATEALQTAIAALAIKAADKAALQTKITEAETFTEAAYTAESWARFATALAAANAVNGKENAKQSEIEAAKAALENAINELVLEITLYQYISTYPVWQWVRSHNQENTMNIPTKRIIPIAAVNTEEGLELALMAPERGDWKWGSDAAPTLYWKTTLLRGVNNWQTLHDEGYPGAKEDNDPEVGIRDMSLDGIEFTHIRYYDGKWEVKTLDANDPWMEVTEQDQLVSYYLMKTPTTKEVNTYVKDWAFKTNNAEQGACQKALSFAVVYPDGQIRPSETDIYADSTLIYWDNLSNLGFILFEEAFEYYGITKITYTMGERNGHDDFANVHTPWTTEDSIIWEKENGWYDETTVWTSDSGTAPIVDGRQLTDVIYPGNSQGRHNSYVTDYDGSWGKDDAVLLLVYVEVKGDLNVKYVDDSEDGETFLEFGIQGDEPTDSFRDDFTVLRDPDGDGPNPAEEISGLRDTNEDGIVDDFYDDSTIINVSGNEKTVEKDLTKIPNVEDKYKNGLYEYKYAEVSEDGKTLILHYDVKPVLEVKYVDGSTGEEFYSDYVVQEDANETFKNSETFKPLEDTDGDGDQDIVEGSYIKNEQGTNESVETDLEQIDAVDDKYKEKYSYQYVEVSEDGKTLTVYYIPIFKFVVDFGLPVEVDMAKLNPDKITITEVTETKIDDADVYGSMSANGTKVIYTLETVMKDVQTGTVKYQYTNAGSATQEGTIAIQFIPATTVYYEEGFADFSEGWTGGSKGNGIQQAAVPGDDNDFNNDDIAAYNYGYDAAYGNAVGASGGTEAVSNANANIAEFYFRGTGVEIYTNNTPETGSVMLYLSEVKNGTPTLKGMYLVDTVMANGSEAGTAAQAVSAYNVPIVDIRDLKYGDYHVKLRHVVLGEEKAIKFDGFRVIGTLPMDNAAYALDEEANPEFVELRDSALAAHLPENADFTELRHAEELANGVKSQVYANMLAENPNHMLNATMSASSVEGGTDFNPSNAGDGKENTRWSSKYPSNNGGSYGFDTDPWLKAEFDEFTNIKQINITFHSRNTGIAPSNVSQFSIKYEKAVVDDDNHAVYDETTGNILTEEIYAVEQYQNAVKDTGYSETVTIVLDKPITAKSIKICDFVANASTWNNIGIVEVEAYTQETALYEQQRARALVLTTEDIIDSKVEIDKLENGPKNEIYLQKGDVLMFKINAERAQIGLKALNAATSYTISKGEDAGTEKTLASSTDLYYDLNTEGQQATYTITNTGDGILSVTLLKLIGAQNVSEAITAQDLQPALASLGYATAKEPAATPVTEVFSDVAENAWYTEAVQYVYDAGIMAGDNGMFNPAKDMTRAQLVTTLYRLAGSPEVTDYSACDAFTDVAEGAWYTDAVCWAYTEGITGGNSATTFGTNVSLTREQLATFFYRYANSIGLDTTAEADLSGMENVDKVKTYAEDAVKWAVGTGVINGKEVTDAKDNISYDLAPQATATRAQLAMVLMNFCEAYDL